MNTEALKPVVFITGNWGRWVGGPYQTWNAYRDALMAEGRLVTTIAFATSNSPVTHKSPFLHLVKFANLVRALTDLRPHKGSTFIFLGVWHPMFLLAAPVVLMVGKPAALILVPTQSLSPIDWQKHRAIKRCLRSYLGMLLRQMDSVIFASSGEATECDPPVCTTVSQVVHHPMTRPDVRPTKDHSDRKSEVAILGRIHPQKDHALALRAVARLNGVRLNVVGNGEQEYVQELKNLAAEMGLSSRVEWHGWKERNDALRVVQRCSVAIVTSKAENYCHAAVESMYVGTPVIMVDRIASSSDFEKASAILRVPSSPESVAMAVFKVLEDRALASSLSAAGCSFAERQAGPPARLEVCRVVRGAESFREMRQHSYLARRAPVRVLFRRFKEAKCERK